MDIPMHCRTGKVLPIFQPIGHSPISAQMNDVIKYAYNIGYRLFDTAQMYHNEDALGNAIQANLIDRNDIFLSAKLITATKAMKTQLQVFMILCQS